MKEANRMKVESFHWLSVYNPYLFTNHILKLTKVC